MWRGRGKKNQRASQGACFSAPWLARIFNSSEASTGSLPDPPAGASPRNQIHFSLRARFRGEVSDPVG